MIDSNIKPKIDCDISKINIDVNDTKAVFTLEKLQFF